MARGEDMPSVLNLRMIKVFGSYPLDSSMTELLVKIGKFVFKGNFSAQASIDARFAMVS